MTAEQFFISLSGANSTYIKSAAQSLAVNTASKPQKNRRPLRYLLIAATLTLILAAILLPIALGKDPVVPPDTTKEYTDLATVEGAILSPDATLFDHRFEGKISAKDGYTEWIKQNTALIGTVSNTTSVLLEGSDSHWHLTTLRIMVEDALCHPTEQSEITAIVLCEYTEKNGAYRKADRQLLADFGFTSMETPYGLYVLESAQGQSLTVGGTVFTLSDYADYVLTLRLDVNGDRAAFGELIKINLEDLRSTN